MRRRALLAWPLLLALAACGAALHGPAPSPPPGSTPSAPRGSASGSLARLAAARQLLWGTAITLPDLQDPGLRQLIAQQTSAITPENALKWDATEPQPGSFNLEEGDALVQFARQQGLAVRGHTLLWHQQLPGWLTALPAPELRRALERHVRTLAGHWRGQIHTWDVINEPIDEQGRGLRRSLWLERLGPGVYADTLRWAHEADPSARLAINEYGLEGDDPQTARKREALLTLVRDLRRRGAPLQVIGLQAHLLAPQQGAPQFRTLPTFLETLRQLGLEVQITELDVSDRQLPADPGRRDGAVAVTYGAFLAAVLPEPALRLVGTWGLSDQRSWLNQAFPRRDGLPQRPLPYDNTLRPKAARSSIAAGLMQQPPSP